MKKILLLLLLFSSMAFGQVKLSQLTEATDFEDDSIFLVSVDTSGSGNYATRRFEWDNFKLELARELVFNQAGIRVVAATDTIIRVDASGNLYLGDKSIVPIYISNAGDVGMGLTTPSSPLHVYDASSGTPFVTVESEQGGTQGGGIVLLLDSSSPADNDLLGSIIGQGRGSTNLLTNYSTITFLSEDATAADAAGSTRFYNLLDNTTTEFMALDGYTGVVGSGYINLNPTNADINVGIGTASPTEDLHFYDNISGSPDFLIESENTGTVGPSLEFYLNTSSPAASDEIARISFATNNSGAGKNDFVEIIAKNSHPTVDDESGQLDIDVDINQTSSTVFEIDGHFGAVGEGRVTFNQDSHDWDLVVESDNLATALVLDAAEDSLYINADLTYKSVYFDTTGMGANSTFTLANAGGGQWTDAGSFLKPSDAGDNSIHIMDTAQDDSASITVDDSGNLILTQSGTGVGIGGISSPEGELHIYSTSGTASPKIVLESDQDGNEGAWFRFILDSESPADGDILGSLNWSGYDSGDLIRGFGWIEAYAVDVTLNDWAGEIRFDVSMDAQQRNFIKASGYNGSVNEGLLIFNEDGQDVDIRFESAGVDSAFTINGANGNIYMEGLGSGTGTQLSRVANTDQIVEETSSKRFKSNVKNWNPQTDILNFRPVSFKWNKKSANNGQKGYGLIAEDVAKLLPEAAQYDENKNVKNYDNRVVMAYMISEMQNQKLQIIELNKQLEELRALFFKEHIN
jgi:hypothetical protein